MAWLIRYNNTDKVIDTQKVITSTWSNNTNNANAFAIFSSSGVGGVASTASAAFFIEVYNTASTSVTKETQYAVAYGNKKGSGSLDFTNDTGAHGNSATRIIYNQYRQLVYGDETSDFNFNGTTPDGIYVININRARYKNNLKPGSLNLVLSGSGGKLHLTDNSITSTGSAVVTNLGRQFNIVSGSNGQALNNVINQVANSSSYGLFYPDAGIIILNPDNFGGNLAPDTNSGVSTNTDLNHRKLYQAISGAKHFIVDSQEKVTSQYYFTRAKNNEFNYTTNPSFVDANGDVNIDSFINNPQTFITTVGLYNDNNDLVAVAKLSQPVTKDFTKEALIRVKLDY